MTITETTPILDPAPETTLSEVLENTIHQHGFAIHAVLAEELGEPHVFYTVGLSTLTGFELMLAMAADAQLLGQLFQNAAAWASGKKQGAALEVAHGVIDTRLGTMMVKGQEQPLRCVYRTVADLERAVEKMQYRAQSVASIYQLILPDMANVLPGEPGFDERFAQPL